jgi:hypothetical protein
MLSYAVELSVIFSIGQPGDGTDQAKHHHPDLDPLPCRKGDVRSGPLCAALEHQRSDQTGHGADQRAKD